MHYHFYILYSKTLNKYYIGYTGDNIFERLRKHNTNHSGFTGGIGDWELVYFELMESKEAAIKQVKTGKSMEKQKMIETLIAQKSKHPD